MKSNFRNIIGWNWKQYVFFILILGVVSLMFGAFWFAMDLRSYVRHGLLNIILVKPVNPFIFYILDTTSVIFFLNSVINFLFLVAFLVFFKIRIYNIPLLIGFNILAGIFFVLCHRFIESFSFFFKDYKVFFKLYSSSYKIFDVYPSTMFGRHWWLLLFANTFIGAYSTNIAFNLSAFSEIKFLILYLIFANVLLGFLIYLSWSLGLKRYESFGG